MKTYTVKPGLGYVEVKVGKRPPRKLMVPPPFEWGTSTVAAVRLAKAILEDVFGDEQRALRLMQRFKWRTVATWPKDKPYSITDEEVRAIVADMDETQQDYRGELRKVGALKPMMVTDRAGPNQVWDSNPDIVANPPPKPKEPA